MDENETVKDAIDRKCRCGGILKVVKTPEGRKVRIVCRSCGTEQP